MYAQAKKSSITQSFTPLTDTEFFYFSGREDLLCMYLALKRYCWGQKTTCHPSVERLAGEIDRHADTVRRRLADLAGQNVIQILHVSGGHNRYKLNAPDEWLLKKRPATKSSHLSERLQACPLTPCMDVDPPPAPVQGETNKYNQIKKTNKHGVPDSESRSVLPVTRQTARRDRVVVPSEISSAVRSRLEALGGAITPVVASTISRYDSDALERALFCLEAARHVENPAGYLMAALTRNWSPPASFVKARQKKADERDKRWAHLQREIQALSQQQEIQHSAEELEREVEGCLQAEQERRQLFGNYRPFTSEDLQRRRGQLQERVKQQWRAESERCQRQLNVLMWELDRLQ